MVPSTVSALRSGQGMGPWGLECRTEVRSWKLPGGESDGECKGGSGVGQGSEEILSREGVRGWRVGDGSREVSSNKNTSKKDKDSQMTYK